MNDANALHAMRALYGPTAEEQVALLVDASDRLAAMVQRLRGQRTTEQAEQVRNQLHAMHREASRLVDALASRGEAQQ